MHYRGNMSNFERPRDIHRQNHRPQTPILYGTTRLGAVSESAGDGQLKLGRLQLRQTSRRLAQSLPMYRVCHQIINTAA